MNALAAEWSAKPSISRAIILRVMDLTPLAAFGPVDGDAMTALAVISSPRRFERGAMLLRAGQHAEWCHLVQTGLVREFYLGVDGHEHIRTFVRERDLTGSLYDLMSGLPAITSIEALEPTHTVAFRFADFERLCQKHHTLHVLARRVAERLYVRKIRREYDMLVLTASERLRRWLKEEPELDGRISRRHLAMYLGITPEHLSRLQTRMHPADPRRPVRRTSA